MARSTLFVERPTVIPTTVGGANAVLLASGLAYAAPVAGLPALDVAHLVGGVFSADPAAAPWIGYGVVFLVGWLVLPAVLRLAWGALPGDPVDVPGALLRGLLFGLSVFIAAGLLLPLFGALNRLPDVVGPGLFAAGLGAGGIVTLLLAALAYGVALALVAAMGRGLSPLDCLGWEGHGAGRHA